MMLLMLRSNNQRKSIFPMQVFYFNSKFICFEWIYGALSMVKTFRLFPLDRGSSSFEITSDSWRKILQVAWEMFLFDLAEEKPPVTLKGADTCLLVYWDAF